MESTKKLEMLKKLASKVKNKSPLDLEKLNKAFSGTLEVIPQDYSYMNSLDDDEQDEENKIKRSIKYRDMTRLP